MRIVYRTSVDDLIKLNMDGFKRDSVIQKRIKLKHVILPILIIIDFLVVSWFDKFAWNKSTNLFFIFCLAIIIPWVLFYPKLAEFQYKRMIIKRLNNNLKDYSEAILTISQDGINQERKNGSVRFLWNEIEEVKDVGTHIFIYINNLNAIVIPSSAFKNDEEKKALIDIIENNIKNN